MTYQAFSVTTVQPDSRYGEAREADCQDVGEDNKGPVFDTGSSAVEAWTFAGVDPAQALGVRFDDSWRVFISTTLSADERDSLIDELDGRGR